MTDRSRRRRRRRVPAKLVASGAIVAAVLLIAALAPWIAPHDPTMLNTRAILRGPSPEYLLGTDEFGRDLFSRVILGARPSLTIALGATALAAALGTALGLVAGFFRGSIEQLFMRSLDVLLSFPPILLAMMIVGFAGSGIGNLIVVIGVLYVPTFGRLAYGATLQVAKLEYVEATLALGARAPAVLLRHVLPNILSPLIVQVSLTTAAAILLESGLSFLGLGVKPPTPSWGLMIDTARQYMLLSPTYLIAAASPLVVVVLSINVLGDALRDYLDPKL